MKVHNTTYVNFFWTPMTDPILIWQLMMHYQFWPLTLYTV